MPNKTPPPQTNMSTLVTHIGVQWAQHKHRWFYFLQPLVYLLVLSVFIGLGGLNAILPPPQLILSFYALVTLITLQRHYELLFLDDWQDGNLKQYLIHQQLFHYTLAHVSVWWCLSTLPILLGALCVAWSLALNLLSILLLASTLTLVSITTTWVCAFSSAITLPHPKSDFMRALISLPLLISLYVLAMGVERFHDIFWVITSLAILTCTLLPLLTANALKVSIRA